MADLVLSLFPGVGLLDMAFEAAGFCVVRGPDLLWGGDIHAFHPPPGRFEGVIAGPPCQAFSRLRHIVEANGLQVAPNLIPEFERCVREARPTWFLMENVPTAPEPQVFGDWRQTSQVLRDVWVGGETTRERRFTFGSRNPEARFWVETLALHRPDPERAALAGGNGRPAPIRIGGSGKPKRSARSALCNMGYKTADAFARHKRLQGLPDDYDLPPFTVEAKVNGQRRAAGNGARGGPGRAGSPGPGGMNA